MSQKDKDWVKIKTEYVTTNTTYAKLSRKYHVGTNALSLHAQAENWREEREAFRKKTVEKKINVASEKQVKRYERLQNICDSLLDKIEKSIEALTESECLVDKTVYRNISGALKDIKEIQSLKGELDIQEQRARIAKLQKEAEDEDNSNTEVIVRFEGDNIDDYSK